MDIQQLRYFVSVAQHLSFSKAARHLYIAQPGLSQSIARLEKELGVKLLHRDRRSVELTRAGEIFLKESVEIIAKSEKAIAKARQVGSDFSGNLVIGFLPSLGDRYIPAWISSFNNKYPKINVVLRLFTEGSIHPALEEGDIDIGYARYYSSHDEPEMRWRFVSIGTMSFVVPKDHSFANRKKTQFIDLCNEPLVLMSKQETPRWIHFLKQYFRQKGIEPNIVDYARRMDGLLPLVACGVGISIIPSLSARENPEVRFIQITDKDSHFKIGLKWKKTNTNENISLLVNDIIPFANNLSSVYT